MRDEANKKFWERNAKIYTAVQEKGNKKLYDSLGKIIKPWILDNYKVLELACGTGQLTVRLANRSKNWNATDFSPNMLKVAKNRYHSNKVLLEVQDATNLTYDDQIFDVVLIANALHIMPNPDKALKEIKRVLKPGGILIAPTFVYEGNINKIKLRIMEINGLKTYYKWIGKEYEHFMVSNGFSIISNDVVREKFLPECVLICKNTS